MKAVPFMLVAIMTCTASVRSQVMDAATIREPVAPVASPTTACILGDLPDGTPPPPQPPKPIFVVAAKDVLMPRFPGGKATFSIIGDPPADPEVLVPIQALHDIYNNEFARLKAAYEGRERAQLQREAELKANPPRPKNITLNYWRTERPAPPKGGAK